VAVVNGFMTPFFSEKRAAQLQRRRHFAAGDLRVSIGDQVVSLMTCAVDAVATAVFESRSQRTDRGGRVMCADRITVRRPDRCVPLR
jgi:hypothetical protein